MQIIMRTLTGTQEENNLIQYTHTHTKMSVPSFVEIGCVNGSIAKSPTIVSYLFRHYHSVDRL